MALIQGLNFVGINLLAVRFRGGFMTTIQFFVIGSWAEGMLNFKKIQHFVSSISAAALKGAVYRHPIGFPVLLEQGEQQIQGQLLQLTLDETLLSLLDTFHGVNPKDPEKGLHFRKSVQVQRADGAACEAQVYFFNPKKVTSKMCVISDETWQENLQKEPSLVESLSDRQKTYVLKLGSVKGRDIVPINDLTLYRELMKLELIVDKGRRLALSSLGKEVYNHLR